MLGEAFMGKRKDIIIPVERNLRFKTFEQQLLLYASQKMAKARPNTRVIFSLKDTHRSDLMELTCLLVIAEQFAREECKVLFDFSGASKELTDFARAWQFPARALERGYEITLTDSQIGSSERLLPIFLLDDRKSLRYLCLRVREILQQIFPWVAPNQVNNFVSRIMLEGCENILDHAYDQYDPCCSYQSKFLAVRTYKCPPIINEKYYAPRDWLVAPPWMQNLMLSHPGIDFVEIAVVDGGAGIYARLGESFRNYVSKNLASKSRHISPDTSEKACLQWATSPARSSSLDEPGRGYGLFTLKLSATNGWGGAFYLRSGHTLVVYLENDTLTKRDNLARLAGTQLRVFLPVRDRSEQIDLVEAKISRLIGQDYER
jgi:hypothetical protein